MRITVCDFPDEPDRHDAMWGELSEYLAANPAEVLVLPEMPFSYWIFDADSVDATKWQAALDAHDKMISKLPELDVQTVLSSRPVQREDLRLNEAFIWQKGTGYHGVRCKWYLPDAPDGRETIWFDKGDLDFSPKTAGALNVGFQLCSEMIYSEHAREIGLRNGNLIAQPRCTGGSERWRIAAQMSAMTSGCFVASANRQSFDRDWYSGGSWIVSPEAQILAETKVDRPIASASIDLSEAVEAKSTHPRDMHRMYR